MTPESLALQLAITLFALLLAALGALMLFKGAREDADAPAPALSDGRIRIGDGTGVLRFRLEVEPSGHRAFRAETLRASRN